MTALHYAYNKDAITTRILAGAASPTCNFMSPLAWSYSKAAAATCPPSSGDSAKAQAALDAAGFKKGSDGTLVAANGTPVNLLACTAATRAVRINTLTLVASQLKPYGINLTVKGVPASPDLFGGWTQVAADTPCNTTHGNFDVAEFAWVSGIDPTAIYYLYLSTMDPSQGDHSGSNYIRVNNPDLDAMLKEMVATVDLNQVRTDMAKIQALYIDPVNAFPEIPLYDWKTVELVNPKMHNVVNNSTSATNTWNIEDWWRAQ